MRSWVLVIGVLATACGGGGGTIVIGDQGPRDDYFSVDMADMNGDGLNDMVAGRFSILADGTKRDSICVFLQQSGSAGTFAAPKAYEYAPHPAAPVQVHAADLQGDGHPDVVVSGFTELGFRVLLNDSSAPGTLLPSVHYGPPGKPLGWPQLAVADIDGDLRLDVLIAGDVSLTVYPQSASIPGTFLEPAPIGQGYEVPAAGDVDGDGTTDAATLYADNGSGIPGSLLYYRQSLGTPGQFLAPIPIKLGFAGGAIGIADLDRDGLPDFAVSGFDGGGLDDFYGVLSVFRQTATNVFEQTERHRTSSNLFANRMAIADLDGDGDLEIVLGQRTGAARPNTLEIFSRTDQGLYASSAVLTVPNDRAVTVPELYSVSIGDLNNDSLADIAVSTHEIFVFFAAPGDPGVYPSATRIAAQR